MKNEIQEKDIIEKSIECLSNAKLNNTTYEVSRDIVLDYITRLQENYERIYNENCILRERIEYLKRSNNRREDEIMSLRGEINDYEDYKSILETTKEDIEFCLISIRQESEMSKDERTRSEMKSCIQILEETLKLIRK